MAPGSNVTGSSDKHGCAIVSSQRHRIRLQDATRFRILCTAEDKLKGAGVALKWRCGAPGITDIVSLLSATSRPAAIRTRSGLVLT